MPKSFVSLAAAALAIVALVPAEAAAQRRGEQAQAWRGARAGELRPFREMMGTARREAGGLPVIGTEFDDQAAVYRFKFMRDGSVFWVDVDGRTGSVIGRSDR